MELNWHRVMAYMCAAYSILELPAPLMLNGAAINFFLQPPTIL
jgi:hypothetical protein